MHPGQFQLNISRIKNLGINVLKYIPDHYKELNSSLYVIFQSIKYF